MCLIKKQKNEISLEKLYDKIRESKTMYEDGQYYCRIMLVQGTQTTPIAYQGVEKDVDSAINAIPIRLKQELALTSPASIRFEYILYSEIGSIPLKKNMTILWEEYVDVIDIIKQNEAFVENTIEKAKQVVPKMEEIKIPNK